MRARSAVSAAETARDPRPPRSPPPGDSPSTPRVSSGPSRVALAASRVRRAREPGRRGSAATGECESAANVGTLGWRPGVRGLEASRGSVSILTHSDDEYLEVGWYFDLPPRLSLQSRCLHFSRDGLPLHLSSRSAINSREFFGFSLIPLFPRGRRQC